MQANLKVLLQRLNSTLYHRPTPLPDQIQPKVSVTDRLKLGISFIPKMDGLWLKNKKIGRAFFEKTRVLYVAMAEKPLLAIVAKSGF